MKTARNLVAKKKIENRGREDRNMSHPGLAFTDTNPDKATHMTGIHGKGKGRHPRLEHIHEGLRKEYK